MRISITSMSSEKTKSHHFSLIFVYETVIWMVVYDRKRESTVIYLALILFGFCFT